MNVIERIESGELTVSVGINNKNKSQEQITSARELLSLARIGQQMKWISVKERLPEHETDVDIFLRDGFRRTDVLFTSYCDGFPDFYWVAKDVIYPLSEVTHWMPIPQPPKEDK